MKPIIYRCEVHQTAFIRSEEQKSSPITMVVLAKVANKLQYGDTLFTPGTGNVFRLSGMNDRKKIRTRNYFAHLELTSIKIFILIINGRDVDLVNYFFLLFYFVSVQLLLALKAVLFEKFRLVDPAALPEALVLNFDQILHLLRSFIIIMDFVFLVKI